MAPSNVPANPDARRLCAEGVVEGGLESGGFRCPETVCRACPNVLHFRHDNRELRIPLPNTSTLPERGGEAKGESAGCWDSLFRRGTALRLPAGVVGRA